MPSESLEQQAMDRVARMYSSFDRRPSDRKQQIPEPSREPEPEPEKPPEPAEKPDKRGGLLEYLMKDKEQSMIMLLLVILMKDGADMNLILALIYLII